MTTQEFSNEFDILYNNIMSNQAPGLNEYEKSVFLTQAQESLVISLYNGNSPLAESFESSEELRRYLDSLIKTAELKQVEGSDIKLSEFSSFYNLPDDILFITYEVVLLNNSSCSCKNKYIKVVPVKQDDLHHTISNPFKTFGENRILRLDNGKSSVELLSEYDINKYIIRYISKPSPIIITDLNEFYPELSINGISNTTECQLNSALHGEILRRAVELAKSSYVK
jgi:hypothetical protein